MIHFKRLLPRLALCAGVVLLPMNVMGQSPGPSRVQGASSEKQADARFRLPHAIEIAEREGRGKAITAVFTPFAAGGGALEVTVMRDDKTVVKYAVDANHGAVVNVSEQTLASYLSSIDPAALAGLSPMAQAIAAVESAADGGSVIGAEVETADGKLAYQVTILKDADTREFTVTSEGKVEAN